MKRAENEVQGSESVAQAVQKVKGIRSKGSKGPEELPGLLVVKAKRMRQKKCFKKGKPTRKIVKCIHNEENSENVETSDSEANELGSVTTVHRVVQRAKTLVHINGRPVKIEFDTGAAQSIVNKYLYAKLGSPRYCHRQLPSGQLTAYANIRARSFRQRDEVWVKNECYLVGTLIRQKHADQIRSRSGATDDKPTQTVVNQQQEVEVQESQLPEQQLREQDLRPRPEVETQEKTEEKDNVPELKQFTDVSGVFEEVLSDDIWEMLSTGTNRYAKQVLESEQYKEKEIDKTWFDVNPDEMKAFFALCIIMSQVKKPWVQMNWSKSNNSHSNIWRDNSIQKVLGYL
ncbi:hypothetical protein J437_LFUL009010 [Ladona fulva]|uniref:PiggyBac transposable element-derived protein domain-containing protein n=1 Tax=Ladona fulva TaxID=123851 RepID=A0A8K0P122_LADFU|nr:hypothetical protein J437_LFUL009010 [Ladona fulva]